MPKSKFEPVLTKIAGFEEITIQRRAKAPLVVRQASGDDDRSPGDTALFIGIRGGSDRWTRSEVAQLHETLGHWLETGSLDLGDVEPLIDEREFDDD